MFSNQIKSSNYAAKQGNKSLYHIGDIAKCKALKLIYHNIISNSPNRLFLSSLTQ